MVLSTTSPKHLKRYRPKRGSSKLGLMMCEWDKRRLDFNRSWFFVKSEAEWPDDFLDGAPAGGAVSLPHTWNADDMGVGRRDPHLGSGWYRKTFEAPLRPDGARVLLEFEGATNLFNVWVNNGYAGGRNGGFLATSLDITDFLEEGENTILVRVDNRYDLLAAMPRDIDWNRYGGITRPVWMYIRKHAFIEQDGIQVQTGLLAKGAMWTRVQTSVAETLHAGSDLELLHTLIAPNGEAVTRHRLPLRTRFGLSANAAVELAPITKPALWSDEHPVLYTLKTQLFDGDEVIDERSTRIGYRVCRFDPDRGFLLNGKPTKLRGANIHAFFPGLGNALPERFYRSEMERMKRMGCNYMRTSHYPRPRACLEACDELGILVLEEQPYWHGSLRAISGEAAIDNCSRLVKDMVRQHGNHPCIIAWNTVNEVMLAPAYKPGIGHLGPDDPRRAAWAINPKEYPYIRRHLGKMIEAFKEADPYRPVGMVVGGAWQKNDDAGLTQMSDFVAYNGGALNFSEGFIGPENNKHYAFRPDYYRDIYPDRVHVMSEGVLNDVCYARGDWEREDTAWRQSAKYWDCFYSRDWFCGGSMWCFTDYSANGDIRLHGAVDRFRLEKELFYFYAAMWSELPVLHIRGHWNHASGSRRDVVVFTNGEDVTLALNGRDLEPGLSCSDEYPHLPHPPWVWQNVNFERGVLTATALHHGKPVSDSRVTAGEPARIVVEPLQSTLVADGRDITYVDVMIQDADGNRCYTEHCRLLASGHGAATVAGDGEVEVKGGVGRFALRTNGEQGTVKVRVCGTALEQGEAGLRAEGCRR